MIIIVNSYCIMILSLINFFVYNVSSQFKHCSLDPLQTDLPGPFIIL